MRSLVRFVFLLGNLDKWSWLHSVAFATTTTSPASRTPTMTSQWKKSHLKLDMSHYRIRLPEVTTYKPSDFHPIAPLRSDPAPGGRPFPRPSPQTLRNLHGPLDPLRMLRDPPDPPLWKSLDPADHGRDLPSTRPMMGKHYAMVRKIIVLLKLPWIGLYTQFQTAPCVKAKGNQVVIQIS